VHRTALFFRAVGAKGALLRRKKAAMNLHGGCARAAKFARWGKFEITVDFFKNRGTITGKI